MLELFTKYAPIGLGASLLTTVTLFASSASQATAPPDAMPQALDRSIVHAASAFACGQAHTAPAHEAIPLDRALDRALFEREHAVDRQAAARLDRLDRAVRTARLRGGDAIRVQCAGTAPRTLRPITWQIRLQQVERVVTASGELLLSAFEDRHAVHDPRDDRRVADVLVAESIALPDRKDWRIGGDGESLRAVRAARRAGAACANALTGRCTQAVTIDWWLGGSPERPELVQSRYIDGEAVGTVRWRLTK